MDHNNYTSPFSWRYGSTKMRHLFSEKHKYELWRRIWVALAEAQYEAGLVSKEELNDLKKHQNDIDINKILENEKETKHDVFAAIQEFASHAKIGGGKIHLGATSMDINDNADILRFKESIELLEIKIKELLQIFAEKINQYVNVPCMAYKHLQPAEPTTVGYRLSLYAQDLITDLDLLNFVKKTLKGKGIKGAVGTAASYDQLLKENKMNVEELEKKVMDSLGIDAVLISSQVYPRKFDYFILTVLASISSSAAKFAGDLRILQSPLFGEWSESFGKKQVGSSAMPFKKNPINSEKICSLARYVAQLPVVALENASLSYLERTLDDSANRRMMIPEAFLSVDEILITYKKILSEIIINEKRISQNLEQYAPFAASEGILMECSKRGADRQKMHEELKMIAMEAWKTIQNGDENPIERLLVENTIIGKYLSKKEVKNLLDVSHHLGNAVQRSLLLVEKINNVV
ncbi:MAG TPA: adenylosuccinate lyase [Candidatus Nitrosocosmicus sp.]|nr:adenylosuccinate lyase [Candidatus Nitrosocosmicus sp.]